MRIKNKNENNFDGFCIASTLKGSCCHNKNGTSFKIDDDCIFDTLQNHKQKQSHLKKKITKISLKLMKSFLITMKRMIDLLYRKE